MAGEEHESQEDTQNLNKQSSTRQRRRGLNKGSNQDGNRWKSKRENTTREWGKSDKTLETRVAKNPSYEATCSHTEHCTVRTLPYRIRPDSNTRVWQDPDKNSVNININFTSGRNSQKLGTKLHVKIQHLHNQKMINRYFSKINIII